MLRDSLRLHIGDHGPVPGHRRLVTHGDGDLEPRVHYIRTRTNGKPRYPIDASTVETIVFVVANVEVAVTAHEDQAVEVIIQRIPRLAVPSAATAA